MGLLQDFNRMKKDNTDMAETDAICKVLAQKYGFTFDEAIDFVLCDRYNEDDAGLLEEPEEEEDEDA